MDGLSMSAAAVLCLVVENGEGRVACYPQRAVNELRERGLVQIGYDDGHAVLRATDEGERVVIAAARHAAEHGR